MSEILRRRSEKEAFQPSWAGVLLNPAYLMRREIFRAARAFGRTRTGDLLDYGCGSKPYRNLFPMVSSYVGVDVEQSGHDHASSDVDVFFDGTTLPFEDRSFDTVVAFEVLEHVFEQEQMLREMRRVLRPGGTLMITTPFVWPEHEQPYDFSRLTGFGIVELFNRSGFSDVSHAKAGSDVSVIGQLSLNYLLRITNPTGRIASGFRGLALPTLVNLLAVIMNGIAPVTGESYLSNVVTARRSD